MNKPPRLYLTDRVVGKLIVLCALALIVGLLVYYQASAEQSLWVTLLAAAIMVATVYGAYELAGFACAWLIGHTPFCAERRLERVTQRSHQVDEPSAPVGLFKAGAAFLVFGSYAGTQILVWIVIGLAAVGAGGEFDTERFQVLAAPGLLLSMLCAGAVAALVFRHYASIDDYPGGKLHVAIGFRSTSLHSYGLAAVAGLLIGSGTLLLSAQVPLPEGYSPSIIEQAAQTPGLAQYTWVFVALVLAPPIEESLFRGVLLEGLKRSWGLWIAGVLTTLLFLVMHLPQALVYWPAGLGLTIGATSMLLMRVQTGSLGPPITVHFCYNSVMAVAVLLPSPTG